MKPTPLVDWPDSHVQTFLADYHKWAKAHPEIAKTGLTRVALIYRLAIDELVAPLQAEVLAAHHRLANAETTVQLLSTAAPTCPRCGSPMRVVEYDHQRRGHMRELRCSRRHLHTREDSSACPVPTIS